MAKNKAADGTVEAEIESIQNQAREQFDLGAFLRGAPLRTKKVTVYTDIDTGNRIGGVELIRTTDQFGLPREDTHAWGLMGDLSDLVIAEKNAPKDEPAADKAKRTRQVNALKKEITALQAKLAETALEIELHSIPPHIEKDAHRAAREALGIHGKISESDSRYEDLSDERDAQLLTRMVTSITRVGTGEVNKGASIESARALKGYLDKWEYSKITVALGELLFERTIAERAVEDPDF